MRLKPVGEAVSRSDETWRGALVPLETVDAAVDESLFVGDMARCGGAWRWAPLGCCC